MTEQEARAEGREVAVERDKITAEKIALTLTAHAGRTAYSETLRLTRGEAVEVHRALGAFLGAAPSDTDRATHVLRRPEYSTPCLCPATADHSVAEMIANTSQPVRVEVTTAEVDRVAAAIAVAADADYWVDEIAEWEGSEEWEREAHPDNYPGTAYEDRADFRKQARAAVAALGGGDHVE